jgi:hypothetical protein
VAGNYCGLFKCTAQNLSEGTEENLNHVSQSVGLDLKLGPLKHEHLAMMFGHDIIVLYLVFLT